MSATAAQTTPPGPPGGWPTMSHGISATQQVVFVGASTLLFAVATWAVVRMALGYAPSTPEASELPLILHLATVIPAIPLGAYILATRKGGPRHKLLGKVWLGLMVGTAVSTLFLKQINDGSFSFIHLFSVLVLIVAPLAILAARRGNIDAHRKHVTGLFIGALLVAGGFTFLPGRTMWVWAFG